MRYRLRHIALVSTLLALPAFTCGIGPALRDLKARVEALEAAVAELEARPGGIGAGEFAASTGSALAVEGQPAVLIPGLERTLELEAGSNLLVMVDVREWSTFVHSDCLGYVNGRRGQVELEVDGTRVASREFFGDFGNLSNVLSHTLVWLSPPLAAGSHSVRVLVAAADDDGDFNVGETTSCFGFAGDDGREARMVILELLE